jgi:uncharacterized protein DUF4236
MGWFYRKSVKFGPFRLNFSKSGIGVSAGVKGARVSTGPRGTYLNLGTNGIYYRQKIDGPYAASSSLRGAASQTQPNAQYFSSVPSGLGYPEFPKHGPPRIVKTLGYLSIPAVVIFLWILTAIGISLNPNSSSKLASNANTPVNTAVRNSISNRERGFQAGLDYGRTDGTGKSKKLNQRRLKKLAGQISATAKQDQEWELGWIEGYQKAFETSAMRSVNDNRSIVNKPTPSQRASSTLPSIRSPASNGYIRGPRGGCYYLSASGRKVYVDRGLCN